MLWVITLANLTHLSRGYIADGALTGNWQIETDLEWPVIPVSSKWARATFWRFLRLTVCKKLPVNQPAGNSMALDMPLGQ